MTDEVLFKLHRLAQTAMRADEWLTQARDLLSASKPAAIDTQEAKPVGWLIDPGAGEVPDHFQKVEPYEWQLFNVRKFGGSITPLYSAPQPSPTAVVLDDARSAVLADLMRLASEAVDHTPDSFRKNVIALANRAHAISPSDKEK